MLIRIISVVYCFWLGLVVSSYSGNITEETIKSESSARLEKRIIGGELADFKRFPYLVSMYNGFGHKCTGSLLSDRIVLVAGHCLVNKAHFLLPLIRPKDFRIRFGSSKLNTGDQYSRKIKSVHVHEKFRDDIYRYDIGIIVLEKKIEDSEKERLGIEYAKIFNRFVYDDIKTVTLGWGYQSQNGHTSENLLVTDIRLSNGTICKAIEGVYEGNNEFNMCSINTEGKGFCVGDSGGPLVLDGKENYSSEVKNAVVGVSSTVGGIKPDVKCEKINAFNLFINTYYYIDWISRVSEIPRESLEFYKQDSINSPESE
ncbi:Chymotrypsin-1 [Smittium culicis]|uniref:Chymotrypsin-1 n=1 Tax=Smittium culicis TaxID=133412 RepID=A0A1R1X2G3_9FUNG|nr:Chymotrypsin-1 [Smittium culicis]OMJ20866.1 Chymotrypsin-1 [Smittium culicis]